MYKLALQKLVVLNTTAPGWAVNILSLRIAAPIGMPLKKGVGQGWEFWYQQCHSYVGPVVTWLQRYPPMSCSH